MKKIVSIGLGMLLVISTIGITINKHYSGGKLFSYSIFGKADTCCDVNCNCCDEETTIIKVNDDFAGTSFDRIKIFLSKAMVFSVQDLFLTVEEPVQKLTYHSKDISPPSHFSEVEFTQSFLL